MKKTLIFAASCAAFAAFAGVPIKWSVETSRADERVIDVYHGESLDMEVTFKTYGQILELPTNEVAATFWQTNGMNTAYWRTNNVEVIASNGVMRTTFGPEQDVGAKTLRGFIGIPGKIYRAAFVLRFKDAPGYNVSIVEWPYRLLDFRTIEVLNPPYDTSESVAERFANVYTKGETDQVIEERAGNYAAVSNAAVYASNTVRQVVLGEVPLGYANYAAQAYETERALKLRSGNTVKTAGEVFEDLARIDGVESAVEGKASTNDVELIEVYEGGKKYSDWEIEYQGLNGDETIRRVWYTQSGKWNVMTTWSGGGMAEGSPDDLRIEFYHVEYPDYTGIDCHIVCTRTKNKRLGYVLGSQTNKVLVGTNELNAVEKVAKAAATTNAQQSATIADHTTQLGTQSGQIETLGGQLNTIGATLNAEDAKFEVTNYNSQVHMPEASFSVKVLNETTGFEEWLVGWKEMTRWNKFTGVGFNWATWQGFYAWSTNLDERISNKSEREYAFYDGVTGNPAPDGFFWIGQPRVAICAGMAYQRYAEAQGEVWVLESNGMVAEVNGTTNGFFRITDSEKEVQFEIIKGNKRTLAAAPRTMSSQVMGVTHWFTSYATTNAVSNPVARFKRDLTSGDWVDETDLDCPCNTSWTDKGGGIYECEWWPKSTEPQMFMSAVYETGGSTRIVQHAPVEMQKIIIGGVEYTIGTATISGQTVLTLTP